MRSHASRLASGTSWNDRVKSAVVTYLDAYSVLNDLAHATSGDGGWPAHIPDGAEIFALIANGLADLQARADRYASPGDVMTEPPRSDLDVLRTAFANWAPARALVVAIFVARIRLEESYARTVTLARERDALLDLLFGNRRVD